jgi:hypothetical protein
MCTREARVAKSWPNFWARSAKKFDPSHNLHINTNIIGLQAIYVAKADDDVVAIVLLMALPLASVAI